MRNWYSNNIFLKRLNEFNRLERLGLDGPDGSEYSSSYDLCKILTSGMPDGVVFSQNKTVRGKLVAFYCEPLLLAIDIEHPESITRHKEDVDCDRFLTKSGVTVLRFSKASILEKPQVVRNTVLETIDMIRNGETIYRSKKINTDDPSEGNA